MLKGLLVPNKLGQRSYDYAQVRAVSQSKMIIPEWFCVLIGRIIHDGIEGCFVQELFRKGGGLVLGARIHTDARSRDTSVNAESQNAYEKVPDRKALPINVLQRG